VPLERGARNAVARGARGVREDAQDAVRGEPRQRGETRRDLAEVPALGDHETGPKHATRVEVVQHALPAGSFAEPVGPGLDVAVGAGETRVDAEQARRPDDLLLR